MSLKPRSLCVVGVWILSTCVTACTAPFTPTPTTHPQAAHGAPASVEVNVAPGVGATGGRATITVRVVDAFVAPVKDVSVTLEASVGSLTPSAVVTDEKGQGTAVLTAPAGAVKLTATIANGPTSTTLVAVQPTTTTPDPTPNPPPPGTAPGALSVTLTATTVEIGSGTAFSAFVSGGSPQSVSWSYGDGATFTGASTTSAHTYAATGSYAANATVTDTLGRSASASVTATVTGVSTPAPPTPAPLTVSLTVSPGAAGTATNFGLTTFGVVASATWTFGDSTTATTTTPNTTHVYTAAGSYPASVTITDTTGRTASSPTRTVTITTAPPPPPPPTPVVTVTCSQPTPAGSAVTCAVSATLSGASVPSGSITSVDWDFGDATTATTTTNTTSHTYAGPTTYTVHVSNVSVTGTTQKGSGSTTIAVH